MVGGSRLFTIVSTVATASIAPEAPRQWPIIDLFDEMATFRAWSPSATLMALVSAMSPALVAVP